LGFFIAYGLAMAGVSMALSILPPQQPQMALGTMLVCNTSNG
jgi:hypothetical protein